MTEKNKKTKHPIKISLNHTPLKSEFTNTNACCSSTENDTGIHSLNLTNNQTNDHTVEYVVHGMDCPSCAKTIENGVRKLNNVQSVELNYNTGKLKIKTNDFKTLEQLPRTIKQLGYELEQTQEQKHIQTYSIEGMDCASCAKTLEKHFEQQPGVSSVQVNFNTAKMNIEHSKSVKEIINEVNKVGYKATLQGDAAEPSITKSGSQTATIISGIFLVFGYIATLLHMNAFITIIMYAIAIIVGGYKPARSAYYAIKSGSLDMNVLMTVAVVGAILIGEWFEAATVIWLFALGNALQTKSIENTRKSIYSLMKLAPRDAWVIRNQSIVKMSVENIGIGETIIVKPGDKIPLDGEIIEGDSSINQAPITGESIPVDKQVGDLVFAGTINENGLLKVKVIKHVKDTTLSKIIQLVEESQAKKAPTQDFIDKFAGVYTPIVFVLAIMVMIFPPLTGYGEWTEWFYRGLELLVIACPCALVISTPVAIVTAIGNAARNGVLIKGGAYLEIAGKLTAVAFDKTGTITEGKPKVTRVITIDGKEKLLLSIARTMEEQSTHPIAKAIVSYTNEKNISSLKVNSFTNIVGKGIYACIEGTDYYVGNKKLFDELNLSLSDLKQQYEELQQMGDTLVIVGTRVKVLGIIAVSDRIRESANLALKGLQEAGIKEMVMLTGDHDGTAKKVAAETRVTRYRSGLLPEDKVHAIQSLQAEGHIVAMIGDGINDAPALATANIGVAMGGAGTDTAMEAADIVLMADNLEKLPHTVKLSRKALRIIKQNVWFSIIIKLAALILIIPGWLTLWMAVISDTGAALIVILNSLRLIRYK